MPNYPAPSWMIQHPPVMFNHRKTTSRSASAEPLASATDLEPKDHMARATPSRRSERIAGRGDSRDPSVASSDAGGVGRLADSSPAKSHAYGSRGRASVARELKAPATNATQTLSQAFAGSSAQAAASQDRSAVHTATNLDRNADRPSVIQDRGAARTTIRQDRGAVHTATDQDRSATTQRRTSRVATVSNQHRRHIPHPDDEYLPDILEENQMERPVMAGTDVSQNTTRSNSSVADKSYATQREAGFFREFGNYFAPKGTPSSRSATSKRPGPPNPLTVPHGGIPDPTDGEEPPQSPVPTGWATVKRCAIHTSKWLYRWINVALGLGSKFFGAIFWIIVFTCFLDFCLHRSNPFTCTRQRIGQVYETLTQPILHRSTDGRVSNLFGRVNSAEESIADLLKKVPNMIILEQDPTTQEKKIPERFWPAAYDQLNHAKAGDGVAVSWDDFWKRNEGRLQAFLSDQISSEVKKVFANDAVVDKATFQKMLEEYYNSKGTRQIENIVKNFQKTLPQLFAKFRDDWIAKEKGTEWIMPIILENAMLALRAYNFFSATTGATVIPRLTSPTYDRHMAPMQRALGKIIWIPKPNPAFVALQSWEEAGDCWCAAATSPFGKAQIGIKIPQAIYPTKITIEHVPKQAALDIASAPKKLEVWLEVKDEIDRAKVRNAYREISNHNTNSDGPEPPEENYVFVGSYSYDIASPNYAQTFPLDVSFANYDIATNKAVVRVTENYGREWTCLYRLRLHGHLVEESESGTEDSA